MNHRTASGLLADYGQGRLDAEARADVARHLAACAACREWLETYTLLGAALGARREHSHPEVEALAAWALCEDAPTEASEHLASCNECSGDLRLVARAIREARHDRQKEEAVARNLRTKSRAAAFAWLAASLAFAMLLLPLLFAPGTRVEHDRVITGGTLVGEETFVGQSIHASDVRIESGSSIVLEARDLVTFGEGFEVASGASLAVGRVKRAGA